MRSTIAKTLEHVVLLAQHLDLCDLRGAIIAILMELRVPTKSVGFECLKQAIQLQFQDPTRALYGDIYSQIAQRFHQSSEKQVDQAIREVLDVAWQQGSREAWEWYFSYEGNLTVKRPTNSEFISQVAYIIEFWQSCQSREGYHDTQR